MGTLHVDPLQRDISGPRCVFETSNGKKGLDATPDDLAPESTETRAGGCKLERLTPNQWCLRLTREPSHEAELRCRRSRPFAPVRSKPPIRPRRVLGRPSDCCHTARVVAYLGTTISRYAGISSGRYWARTSDPQLVDSAPGSHPFAPVRAIRIIERNAGRQRTGPNATEPRTLPLLPRGSHQRRRRSLETGRRVAENSRRLNGGPLVPADSRPRRV